MALYEANFGGGLYIVANNAGIIEDQELEQGLDVLNAFRARRDKPALSKTYFVGDSPQRMYRATIQKLSVNIGERDEDGNIIRDYRQEIAREQLQ